MSVIYDAKKPPEQARTKSTSPTTTPLPQDPPQPIAAPLTPSRRGRKWLRIVVIIIVIIAVLGGAFALLAAHG